MAYGHVLELKALAIVPLDSTNGGRNHIAESTHRRNQGATRSALPSPKPPLT
jgi:hypothetical protein